MIASVLIIIVLGVRLLIKDKVHPMILYYMWFVVIIKLVMPYGPESSMSIYNMISEERRTGIYDTITNEEVVRVEGDITSEIGTSITMNDNTPVSVTTDNVNDESIERPSFLKTIDDRLDNLTLNKILYIIWIIGIGFFTLRMIYSYRQICKSIRHKKYSNSRIETILLESLNILALKKTVEIVVSDKFNSPALFGVMNPKIIIPRKIMCKCKDEELKYIFLHELSHLKRKDNIVIWISWAIKTIYWFNPIILLSMKLMQNDCELACDASVLSNINDKENVTYGKTILNVLSSINNTKVYVGTTTMIRNKKDVKERIYMISKNKKYGFKTLAIGIALIVTLCVVGLTSQHSLGTSEVEESNIKTTKELIGEKTNSEVIIYNTHYDEEYDDGLTVVDSGELLAENMKLNGLDASFLKNVKETPNFNKTYELSRELIVEGVESYDEKMLVDIHRETYGEPDKHKREIVIILSESSPRYEANKSYATELNNYLTSKGVVSKIYEYKTTGESGHNFNLDLSDRALSINVGSRTSSKEDLDFCVDNLSKALKELN